MAGDTFRRDRHAQFGGIADVAGHPAHDLAGNSASAPPIPTVRLAPWIGSRGCAAAVPSPRAPPAPRPDGGHGPPAWLQRPGAGGPVPPDEAAVVGRIGDGDKRAGRLGHVDRQPGFAPRHDSEHGRRPSPGPWTCTPSSGTRQARAASRPLPPCMAQGLPWTLPLRPRAIRPAGRGRPAGLGLARLRRGDPVACGPRGLGQRGDGRGSGVPLDMRAGAVARSSAARAAQISASPASAGQG
jgi:hypothetical protein